MQQPHPPTSFEDSWSLGEVGESVKFISNLVIKVNTISNLFIKVILISNIFIKVILISNLIIKVILISYPLDSQSFIHLSLLISYL